MENPSIQDRTPGYKISNTVMIAMGVEELVMFNADQSGEKEHRHDPLQIHSKKLYGKQEIGDSLKWCLEDQVHKKNELTEYVLSDYSREWFEQQTPNQ